MKAPENGEVYETEIFTMWFNEENILCIVVKPVDITLENLKETLYKIGEISGHKKVFFMCNASHISFLDKYVRQLAEAEAINYFKAGAFISSTKFGALVINTFLSLNSPGIPLKLFYRENKALEWLRKQQ